MIETSALFAEKIAESSRQFRAKLLDQGADVPGTIRSITINKGACGEEAFSVGSVYSSYIELVMDECTVALQDKELELQLGVVLDDDSVEYVRIGYYTVTKPKRNAYQLTFMAVGRIAAKLNVLPNLPSSQTIENLATAITDKTGIPVIFKGISPVGTIEENLAGLTCKEILEVITVVLGGFATEDSDGNIVVCKFSTENPINYNGDQTTALPAFNDYDYALSGIKVVVSEASETEDGNSISEVSFTNGTPRMTIQTKYMTADLFGAFAKNVLGYTFRPGTVPIALGDPRLEPWDCLEYTDVRGEVYTVPCLNIVHTFDGGLSTNITAPGSSESDDAAQTKGPLVQQLARIAADILTAQEAILKRLRADEILTDDIKSATGSFTKWLTGVRILGDLIEAETLRANTLIIRGTDGLYRRLNIDSLGQMTVDADEKYSQALDGSVLVKESVTAAEINVFDLFAQNIISTGDFNMGGKGALVYDAETDTLLIRARDITIGDSPAVSKEELERLEIGSRNFVRNSKNLIFGDYHFGAEPIKKFKLKTPAITMESDKLGRPIIWTIKELSDGTTAKLGEAVLGAMVLGSE